MTGLQRLEVEWDVDDEAGAQLLAGALPSLAALSALQVTSSGGGAPHLSPQLGVPPDALRQLTLKTLGASWAINALRSAPLLPHVTQLTLEG